MALKTFVKVGNVSNLSDARYCAGMGVQLLGFTFDGEEALATETFTEITGWLSGVDFVAEFDTSDADLIASVAGECDVDYIQVSDYHIIPDIKHVRPIILKYDISLLKDIPNDLPIKYLVVEGDPSGLESPEVSEHLLRLGNKYNLLLGTGITPEVVNALVKQKGIYGIAMKGSGEIRPGYKDYDELADILELLEID
jgi:phosphoribosylanthranilate isomerase